MSLTAFLSQVTKEITQASLWSLPAPELTKHRGEDMEEVN